MRKVSLILLLIVLSTVIAVGSAFAAGVVGTPHDVTTNMGGATGKNAGACSVCHIPHKSLGGNRLWASPMALGAVGHAGGGINGMGIVGQFCGYCHTIGGGAPTLTNANGATNTVYTGTGHDLDASSLSYFVVTGAVQDVNASGLPYTTSAAGSSKYDKDDTSYIQCTSCHNVHDNATNRPFLRANIRDLCIRCHITRGQTGGAWYAQTGVTLTTWGSTYMRTGNPGSHPVGTDVSGDVTLPGNSPIGTWASAPWDGKTTSLMQEFDDTTSLARDITGTYGVWNLGLHVVGSTDTNGTPGTGVAGGVVCVSCHAVHGVQDDSNVTTTQVPTNDNLLARNQLNGSARFGSPSSVLNGDGMPNNPLCEACHWGTGATNFTPNTGIYTLGSYRPNPGGTNYTHPMDDAPIANPAGVTVPAAWPRSNIAGPVGGATNTVICESCHVPHGARNVIKARLDVLAGTSPGGNSGAFILRDNITEICDGCHSGGELTTNHHPTGVFTSMSTTAIPGIGNGDADLTCSDCHGDSNSGAHNWTSASQVGLDKDWVPADNGRGTDAVGQAMTSMSITCERCHYYLTGPASSAQNAIDSPTILPGAGIIGQGAGTTAAAEYQLTGTATHFLGLVNTSDTTAAVKGWTVGTVYGTGPVTGFDPRSTVWPNGRTVTGSGGPAWSRWGSGTSAGAGKNLVCESCHELEPDKNANGSKLLVYFFSEDTTGPRANDNAGTSYFCEGCHGDNGPSNTHALTGGTVSRTNLALSTNTTGSFLATDAPKSTPNITPAGAAGYSTFPAADQVSCDSCHQTHDANTASGTYILDAPEANATSSATSNHGGGTGANHALGTPATPTNLNYTGYCDQCHRYTKTN